MKIYKQITLEMIQKDIRYLELLSHSFPTIASASTEIINLEAIMNLPKGTEHFLADLHGEYEAFQHVLRNASGAIKRKVNEIFGNTLRESEKKEICTLIYYPEQKLQLVKDVETDIVDWKVITLNKLVKICQNVSSKYTRSKVRKALPEEFSYIIQELLHESSMEPNKQAYINVIISTIIDTHRADDFIVAMCNLIQQLTIDSLHILGDIFDRGPGPHIIMDTLCNYHNFDIQWGNHDILWMGAACGNKACIANVIRICSRYDNIDTLEDGYGINIRPLATFALETYKDDNCEKFVPKVFDYNKYIRSDEISIAKIHKAISIIQFKLEGQIIKEHPEYKMDGRLLLDKIDYEKGTIQIDNKIYNLNDTNFPTVDYKNPYKLTKEEEEIINRLQESFKNSETLNKHISFLYSKASMYKCFNSNLLFHGCVPMEEDGEFSKIEVLGESISGKKYFDCIEKIANEAYFGKENNKDAVDFMWYLWCGPKSPLFGKAKAATFERYFVEEKETHKEEKNPYFALIENEEICDKILKEFGLGTKNSHIINGHVPVKEKDGESPIKANGKLLVIDRRICKKL